MGAAARYFGGAVILLEITLVVTIVVRLDEDRNYIGQTLENQLRARALFIEEQLETAQILGRLVAARGTEADQAIAADCAPAGGARNGEAIRRATAGFAEELQSLRSEFRSRGIHRLRYESPCLTVADPPLPETGSAKDRETAPAAATGDGWSFAHTAPGEAESVVSWTTSNSEAKWKTTVDIAASWLWRMTLPMEGAINEVILFSDNRQVVAQSSEPMSLTPAPDLATALAKLQSDAATTPDQLPSDEIVFVATTGKLTHAGDWYSASMKVADSPFILSVFVPFAGFWKFIIDRNIESIVAISIIGLAIFLLYWFVSYRILKPAAAAQRESIELSERLQAIFGAVHDGILLTDRNKAVISTNRSLETLFKVPSPLLSHGAHLNDVAEYLRGRSAALADALLEVTSTEDGSAEANDGSGHWLYLRSAALRETGQMVTVVTDTTWRREMEDALSQARDEAEDAARAKSAFLATMSHEIRTPMNGIVSVAEMLEDLVADDDQRTLIRIIRNSGDVLQAVINDILDFSKIEAGKLDIERIEFDPVDTVDGVARLLAPRAEEQSTDLNVEINPRIPRAVYGDPTRLKQILLNLAGNAIKFTKDGRVEIKVGGTVGEHEIFHLRLEVVDTGIGMTEAQQEGLFTPFQQADSSTSRKFGGSGLGLSICSSLTEMMGGRIGCSSEWQKGSTFWVELPMPVSDPEPHAPAVDIAGARVALIGYGSAEAASLKDYLEHAGVLVPVDSGAVEILANADEALAGIRDADAILLNAKSGLEALRPILPDLWKEVAAGNGKLIVSGPYMARSLLKATGSGEVDIFASISAPINMRRLWHVIAAAQGKVELAEYDSDGTELPLYTPPTVEAARKVNALVLVAEDNVTNQQVIRRILSRIGYASEIASNGIEALTRLKRGGYGILLTDIHMPDMDGFELTQEIRRREAADRGSRLDIVALTADALSQTEAQCREAGMDGYLRKPVVVKGLADVLERIVPQGIALRREASRRGSPPTGTARLEPQASEPSPPPASKQVLDLTTLEETFGELDASVYEIILEFVDSTDGRLESLGSQIDARQLNAAGDTAHAMKGAAQTIGAVNVGRLTAELETACKDDDHEAAVSILRELQSACSELASAAVPLREKTLA